VIELWPKWGTAVVAAVSKCKTEGELAAVLARIEPNLAGYRAWDEKKADQLGELIALVRTEIRGEK
jgi:hypothetical protein